jgi:hypothetical protein
MKSSATRQNGLASLAHSAGANRLLVSERTRRDVENEEVRVLRERTAAERARECGGRCVGLAGAHLKVHQFRTARSLEHLHREQRKHLSHTAHVGRQTSGALAYELETGLGLHAI